MKKALTALAVLLVLAAGGAWLAFHYLDVIVKYALERYAPEVAGVSVKVGDVRISTRDGRGSLKGVEIGNPAGFSAGRAARLGEIRVAVDTATVTENVIRIRELVLDGAQVTYERGPKGANVDVIQQHIEAYVKRTAGEAKAPSDSLVMQKRRFVIDRLTIRGARVLMTNPGLRGQGLTFDLPDVDLRDIGKRQGGVTASEAASIVTGAFQQRIAQKLLTNMDALRRGGVEGAVDALKGLLR
jgi:hypothetical protein